MTPQGKLVSSKGRGDVQFAVYQISTYCVARWLVAVFRTFDEALEFLKRYNYDAEIVVSWGCVLAIKFDGRITITEEGRRYIHPRL